MRILLAIGTTLILSFLASWSSAATMEVKPSCLLSSEGIFDGAWVKHRISVGDQVVYGADDLEAISAELGTLRSQGLCR
ncbi:hypothetical protein B9G69_000630 [Bdellovibrio sp. SKB1291214]|uniref:hypothetical protein n=1 Tax=Bdellovibrio sp. SKB1291214 TaxID=1732569 RepID=UPI000B516B8E|nr:hypothetical protein [Bdellovibrio sp. SKB1291214]UYL09080.1 hypothetical protein B9G69_000630 [Bdellovibrio sp. SKB1291214]